MGHTRPPGGSAALTIGVGCTFAVNGNFTQGPATALEVQLGGTAGGQFGQLTVTGAATLNGTLALTPVGGYTPSSGDAFTIVTFGSRSGDFTTPPAGFALNYDDNGGSLTVVAQ